jgi:thiol:disulfide interchange protein
MLAESVASYLWLLGGVAAAILLALPATGDVRRGVEEGRRIAPRLGRLLGLLAGCCMAGLIATLWWSGPPPEPAGAPTIPDLGRVLWSDFGRGLEIARAENKPIMVAFVTAWCGYCRQMDRVTWKNPEVIDALAEIVAVRVDAEENAERNGYRGVDLAARFGVSTYPTMLLVDSSGRELSRAVGYKEPGEYLNWLRTR